jgi:hypothetical protein
MYKEIVQKLIDVLKASPDLANVKDYYFSSPISFKRFPFIYVQLNGRRFSGKANVNQFLYDLIIEIGIADKAIKEDEAEKSVYDKIETIDDALNSNPSLDGLVSDMKMPRDFEIVHALEGDYSIALAKIIHVARKWI